MQFTRPSKQTQAIVIIAVAAAALAGYYAFRGIFSPASSPFDQQDSFAKRRTAEIEALHADFRAGRYKACLDRVADQSDVFLDRRIDAAKEAFLKLTESKDYPAVAPDADFLRRRAFYSILAESLRRPDQRETVMAVFDFVVRNVASASGPGEKAGIGVMPETVLLRGYGVCDRSAWLFCTLLENLRIASYLVYLRDPETGISHHTIAGVKIDGGIWLFDTYSGMPLLKPDSKIATLADVLKNPDAVDSVSLGGLHQLAKGREIASSIILVALEPETVHPLSAGLAAALGPEAPPLYRDYNGAIAGLAAAVWPDVKLAGNAEPGASNPASNCLVKLWDYPFRIGANLRLPAYRKEVNAAHQWLPALQDARALALVAGQSEEDPYVPALASPKSDDTGREAARYFDALFLLEHKPAKGLAAAARFLDDYPESIWHDAILQTLGEELVSAGKYEEAIEYFRQVSGPRALRAAAFIEAAERERRPEALSPDAMH